MKVNAGDLLHYITWGGGGRGDRLKREPALVAAEAGRGLMTAAGARRYGVVTLAVDSTVDEAATRKLRETIAAERGAVRVFDFGLGGGTQAQLRARNRTPAPAWPRFARAAAPPR